MLGDGGGGPVPLVLLAAPGAGTCTGEPCWREDARGFKYKIKVPGFGLVGLKLLGGQPGKIVARARGYLWRFPLPLPVPTTARVKRGDGAACWEADFSAATVNDIQSFVATSD